jgi:N-methylhydantoinase B
MGSGVALDPITFEVLRHRLDEIVAEAYHTIGRVSGSPVVYEAGDHQEAIMTADGDLASFGAGVLHWVRSLSSGVRYLAQNYAENPGFFPGDQFLVNDPYGAAVHAPDLQVLAPILWEDRLIAWAGTASHQVDVGGMHPGGHHLEATEVYAEGFQTRGLKIVERGVIRKDVEETYANMVRQPELGLLDIRAKIASNNVLTERLLAMVERYGVDTVLTLFTQLIDYSESRLRKKLLSIPDGVWRSANYVEGIVEPELHVHVALTKQGDSVTFDYTGSSPQSAGPENIGVPGAMSGAMASFISMLCHDLPWNEGLFKPVDFVLPEGSIVNPKRPAPMSATIPSGANLLVVTASQNALAKMLLSTEEFREDAAANNNGGFNVPIISGPHRDGSPFTTLILDMLAGGGGALADCDGDSSAHNGWCIKTMIANVETNELMYPVLYLAREEVIDTGGPGRYRGGLGVRTTMMPWGTPELLVVTVGCGARSRSSLGVAGGYPATNVPIRILRGADVESRFFEQGLIPDAASDMGAEIDVVPSKGVMRMKAGDVFQAVGSSGGGGFGDPIRREPAAVLEDVQEGFVSRAMAHEIYGVVLSETGVDEAATAARRQEIRQGRLSRGRV